MTGYIDVPLETDPDALAASALDYLAAAIPGWTPYDGHLEVWQIEAVARMVAEARDVGSTVPTSIFRYFGTSLIGLPSIDDAAATVSSTWTMVDSQGYTVDAGTVVAFRLAGDVLVPFEVVNTFTVSPGNTATLAGQVLLRAVEVGTVGNGRTGAMELVDALAFVASVVATTVSSGGVDAESDEAYLGRLAYELELLTPRPILARDFAVLARRTPGVHRAFAIDNYNPSNGTTNNERMVAVAVVDEAGANVSAGTKAAVDALLQSYREVNFVVHVMDPTRTTVNVSTTFKPLAGYEIPALEDAVEAAIADFLDPGKFGGGDLDPPEWRTTATVVRYLEVASLVDRVPGVDYVASLTLNGGTSDVVLAGVAPLPTVGTVAATAV